MGEQKIDWREKLQESLKKSNAERINALRGQPKAFDSSGTMPVALIEKVVAEVAAKR